MKNKNYEKEYEEKDKESLISVLSTLEELKLNKEFIEIIKSLPNYIDKKELETYLILLTESKEKGFSKKNEMYKIIQKVYNNTKLKYINTKDHKMFIGGTYNKKTDIKKEERKIQDKGIFDKLLESNLLIYEEKTIKRKKYKKYTPKIFEYKHYLINTEHFIKVGIKIEEVKIDKHINYWTKEDLILFLRNYLYNENNKINTKKAIEELKELPYKVFICKIKEKINLIMRLINLPKIETLNFILNNTEEKIYQELVNYKEIIENSEKIYQKLVNSKELNEYIKEKEDLKKNLDKKIKELVKNERSK